MYKIQQSLRMSPFQLLLHLIPYLTVYFLLDLENIAQMISCLANEKIMQVWKLEFIFFHIFLLPKRPSGIYTHHLVLHVTNIFPWERELQVSLIN